MAVPTFPPSKEAGLLSWSSQFSNKITALPTAYGLVAGQASAYAALHAAYSAAYNAANDSTSISKAAIIAKNTAKENLLYGAGGAWELVDVCQAWPDMTDALRGELNIRIPDDEPSPIPPPEFPPLLSIMSTSGRTLEVRLRDKENSDKRGKPPGVQGATVLYHVGETTPADPSQWMFLLNESRTQFFADVPPVVPAGSKVWITAFWFNNRKQSSPVAIAASVRVDEIGNEAPGEPLAEAA
jgi:hypothetical protein